MGAPEEGVVNSERDRAFWSTKHSPGHVLSVLTQPGSLGSTLEVAGLNKELGMGGHH